MQSTRLITLLEFLKSDPNDPFVIYALATEYNSLNNTEQAFHYYHLLIKDHPDYVGTYYHLGKLYEKNQALEKAVETYQKGMAVARNKRDNHAFSELQGAYNSAMGLDYEDD
ncbi:tetratricopeptide repeat protein [Pedobacter immunditicola]|uniref:tetratricopeptide repeat protein n=1 Tax=Pedobacter immunditicola TaxID=3133440 RepID=UPI0030A70AF8